MITTFQIFEALCKWCWQWQNLLQEASNLSVGWNWSFHTFEPQWTRGEGKLPDLALISTESEQTKKTDADEIIDEFASMKPWKGCFNQHVVLFKDEKAEYIDVLMELFSSNTNITWLALNALLYHPNWMYFHL